MLQKVAQGDGSTRLNHQKRISPLVFTATVYLLDKASPIFTEKIWRLQELEMANMHLKFCYLTNLVILNVI
ncbi:hypothetical protein EGJ51_06680 [Pseudomonas fulva]|nr:hypothetical protein EGJ51_06680 [Pseudomonas fulva]